MQLQERIKEIRRQKKISREGLHKRLKSIFGDKAIESNTIWRIESGRTSARLSSLRQICLGLEVSLKEVLIDIGQESKQVDLIKRNQRVDRFLYNQKASAEILSSNQLNFLAQELIILPGGATPIEQDPVELGKFQKLAYCLSGQISCIIGTEKHTLNKGDSLSFESNIPHHFENHSARKARCLIAQNPKHI